MERCMSIEVYIIRRDMSIEVCVIWGIYQTGIHTSAMSGILMLLLAAKQLKVKILDKEIKGTRGWCGSEV